MRRREVDLGLVSDRGGVMTSGQREIHVSTRCEDPKDSVRAVFLVLNV